MADEKLNVLTLAMAKKYTDNSLAGAGATGKAQYNVSYYKPAGSSEEWTVRKLASELWAKTECGVGYEYTNTDLGWTDAEIKTAIARICYWVETEINRDFITKHPLFVRDYHTGFGAGTLMICDNGSNYLYGIYCTYYMGQIYKFNATKNGTSENVELIKFSGTIV